MNPILCRDGSPSSWRQLSRISLFATIFTLTTFADEARTVHFQPLDAPPKFDGWGTSLCWFANAIGQWPEPQRSEIANALFSSSGLGFTVVRYNIGGGENPEHHHMPWFRQMEGFEPAPGEWRWNADAGQRWMLDAAIKRGANRLEAFSNSPPYWMTVSKCASGASNGNLDNLSPLQETAFAEYLTDVVKHFRDTWGITFDTLDPMNEPYTDYWHASGNQEGCHFEHASQARLLQRLRAALDAQGLGAVKISAADETNYGKSIGTWNSYDAKTRDCVAQINTHAYATDQRIEMRTVARESDKPLVMSEVDGGGDSAHDHTSMAPALKLAGLIIDDLRDLQPLRWVFWQAVEDEGGQANSNQNWGLIHADLQGSSHVWALTKKYHAMGNFSKFIRSGTVLVPGDAAGTVAAYDRERELLVIVTCNSRTADAPISYDVASFGRGSMHVETYRTSAKEDLAKISMETVAADHFSAVALAQSITTYVVKLERSQK